MNKFKVLSIFVLVFMAGLFLSGCTHSKSSGDANGGNSGVKNNTETTLPQNAESKNQSFTVTGKISGSGGKYFVTNSSGKSQEMESYSIDFESYVGKTVTVTGQFSGDTLFVTKVE